MRPGAVSPKRSIEERAERLQRRYTGPWKTVVRAAGPIEFTHRYRRRTRIEYLELGVALRDVQRAFWVGILPPMTRLLRLIARVLPG